jgi:CBS domain containing-hemolysin-like protein
LRGYIKSSNLISGLIVAFFTFFIALTVSLGSQALVEAVNNVIVAIILLLIIIFLGIFFDVIGTAATAGEVSPFNARAAKKIFGARQAVNLIRNADRVANFCNDVIGDIAGTLSGAIGAGIVLNLARELQFVDIVLCGAVMTSMIAAITVGGKAIGKTMAIKNANHIVFAVAKVLEYFERISGKSLFNNRR